MGKTVNPSLGINLAALRDDCPVAFEPYNIEVERKQLLKQLNNAVDNGGRAQLLGSKLYRNLPQNLKDFEQALFAPSATASEAIYNPDAWCKKLARAIPAEINGLNALYDLAAIRVERAMKWRGLQNSDIQDALSDAKGALEGGSEVPGDVIECVRGVRVIKKGHSIRVALAYLVLGLDQGLQPNSPLSFAHCCQHLQEGGPREYALEIAREQRALVKRLKSSG